ncbi:hypothetical protein ABS772_07105 [Methylorubrum podarium]|uniref:Uncharacterized protein n=1 Tax=Methylorubrum podarium TaxID=200476 RepID=A0ABV1QJV4_9HYPH
MAGDAGQEHAAARRAGRDPVLEAAMGVIKSRLWQPKLMKCKFEPALAEEALGQITSEKTES